MTMPVFANDIEHALFMATLREYIPEEAAGD
jgi:hypothetical protein